MRNPIQKTKITQLKTSRGIERKMALEKGDIWVHNVYEFKDCVQSQT